LLQKKGGPIAGIYKWLTDTVHDYGNWERGRAVSFLGIHKSDLVGSAAKLGMTPNWVGNRHFVLSLETRALPLRIVERK
jgi:hypothetical protein